MEPWQEEERRQAMARRSLQLLPRCVCCQEPVVTERYLDLQAFGLAEVACEKCAEENFGYWEALMPGKTGGRCYE